MTDAEHRSPQTQSCPCERGCVMDLVKRTPAVADFSELLTYRCRDCQHVETFEEQ